jgi:ElaB/YqjD/DUF883 family membrane-anchored ribosome-binding protein
MSSLTRATDVRDRVSNVVSLFAEQLAGAAKNTERLVRSNPWQAAAIAVVGLAAGILVARGARRVRRSASDRSSASSEVSGG